MSGAWQIAFMAQSVAIVLLGVLLLGVLRRVTPALEGVAGRMTHASDSLAPLGLQPGTSPPPFTVTDDAGSPSALRDLLARSATLVLFLSHDCAPCVSIATQLRSLEPPPEGTQLVVITSHVSHDWPAASARWPHIYRDDAAYSAATAFKTNATPHAFVLDSTGVVRRNFIPTSAEHLIETLRSVGDGAPKEVYSQSTAPTGTANP